MIHDSMIRDSMIHDSMIHDSMNCREIISFYEDNGKISVFGFWFLSSITPRLTGRIETSLGACRCLSLSVISSISPWLLSPECVVPASIIYRWSRCKELNVLVQAQHTILLGLG